MVIDENKLKAFYDHFSLVTVGDSKIPNFPWKETQQKN